MPGPDPLRRLVRAAGRAGASEAAVAGAMGAIDRYEEFVRVRIGDRSLLDAMLSAWVPGARREFELRRKQAAFKAMSQIKGAIARVTVATVVLTPSSDGEHIDVVWLNGLIDLHRVRPGATVKLVSRRVSYGAPAESGRGPMTLEGAPITDPRTLLLAPFSSSPLPRVDVRPSAERVQYTLADEGFGSESAATLVFAEVNRNELPRFVKTAGRKSFFFAEVMTPSEVLQFDVLVHRDPFRGPGPGPAAVRHGVRGFGERQ